MKPNIRTKADAVAYLTTEAQTASPFGLVCRKVLRGRPLARLPQWQRAVVTDAGILPRHGTVAAARRLAAL